MQVALLILEPEWKTTVMWALTAYAFLLRVPSECLPIVNGTGLSDYRQSQNKATIIAGVDCVELLLKRRKNRTQDSHLRRCGYMC